MNGRLNIVSHLESFMNTSAPAGVKKVLNLARWILIAATGLLLYPHIALSLPLFARQTGQSCIACHAGGQFPELTPFGRMFKLTGYTMGERTVPISIMGTVSNSRVANTAKSDDPAGDFQKNGQTILANGSVFLGGKITDNIGAFTQFTHDRYAAQNVNGQFVGHTQIDNSDIRFADRFINGKHDVIVGVSVNNNPSLADPWNTAAAWMQYVPVPSPTSSRFIDGSAPYPSYEAGGNLAGVTAYAFLDRSIYAEFGGYGTSRGALKFMSQGIDSASTTKLKGFNPYWRLAWNREWGAHSLMIGTAGMLARIYDDPSNTSDPATLRHTRDLSVDSQYQYLLDPHAVTVQAVFTRKRIRYSNAQVGAFTPSAFVDAAGNPLAAPGSADSTNLIRTKLTYAYQAKYGGSVGFFNLTGNTNTLNQTSGIDPATGTITSDPTAGAPSTRVAGNISGNPATRGWTFETFWTPIQYLRLGAQYTLYNKFNGSAQNYDGTGRNAKDNNSVFLYLWAAY